MSARRFRTPRRPVRRGSALLGVLAFAAALAAMLYLVDLLRHPLPGVEVVEPPIPAGDPREEIVCPEPQPVEGAGRGAHLRPAAGPERVASDDLYDCPESWHLRRVVYRGEAVGGVLHRDSGAWVQLNDDIYAEAGPLPAHRDYRGGNAGVGVLLPAEVAGEIERVGGPRGRGDVVEVVGTFHRIEPDSREVAVIVAEEGTVVARGEPVNDPVLPDRLVAAIVLAVLALAVVVAERAIALRER